MTVRIGEDEVRELLPMAAALEVVERGLRARTLDRAHDMPRSVARFPPGSLRMLAACAEELGLAGCKVTYGASHGSGRGYLHLVDLDTGELRATVESVHLSRVRTGAATGIATRELARDDAATLGVIGAGSQALAQIEGVCAVRPIRTIRAWSRHADRLRAFCAHAASVVGVAVEPARDARSAVEGAEVVVVITSAAQPVLEGAWLAPGQHVNAAGSNALARRELDEAAIRRCDRIVVDARDVARSECGDLAPLVESGAIAWGDLPELGEILTGRAEGRTRPEQITLYESHGMGVQDLYAAHHVLEAAKQRTGRGRAD
jgi:ornithine cyclodeaminase